MEEHPNTPGTQLATTKPVLLHAEEVPDTQHDPSAELLLRFFAPLDPGTGTSMQRSTTEVFTLLDEHAPAKCHKVGVYDALVKHCFERRMIGPDIVWVLWVR